MKINVFGKERVKGISKKNGNPYDFIKLHYSGLARGVTGLGALVCTIDPSVYPYDHIEVPGDYNIEFDNRGYAVNLSPVPAPSSGK